MSDLFDEQLRALSARSLHRKLREIGSAQGPEIHLTGRRLINFSSNDYLGLAADSRLREAAIAAIKEYGVGAGASRLISGTQSPHVRLEEALARWKGTEAALCFSSGYAAAIGTLPALVSKHDVVILDKLCHASLVDGAKLSGAIIRVFPHNHLGKLESHLDWARRERPGGRLVIVTESVFSMDGDRPPLREIIELKKRFGALLLLDEAHAVGVIGPNGRGLAAEIGLDGDVNVQMGTLSKALGVSGGYICGSRSLVDWLINRARSFVYSTAPPPALAAAALAAVEFLAADEGEARRAPALGAYRGTAQKPSQEQGDLRQFRIRDHSLDDRSGTGRGGSFRFAPEPRFFRSGRSLSNRCQRIRAIAHYRNGSTPRGPYPIALPGDQTAKRLNL